MDVCVYAKHSCFELGLRTTFLPITDIARQKSFVMFCDIFMHDSNSFVTTLYGIGAACQQAGWPTSIKED